VLIGQYVRAFLLQYVEVPMAHRVEVQFGNMDAPKLL
jgi:hypothetical protein